MLRSRELFLCGVSAIELAFDSASERHAFRNESTSMPASRKDGSKRSFRHVTAMMGQRDFAAGFGIPPDFVAPGTGTVERETERAELAGDLAIPEARQPAH
jgi:hypothetical protein